ncbi:UNKNOWN [Stylonychia lemnae]|uniref:Wd40 repeat-containing protein n=1 Tax=Stylonychia lemnae TaxID=5949 RepID=A0A077ZRG6_STYLE|nr:UNKNOWN [Stylonychia lemnae]|eukprot:CDW72487.1 UNKNOWN [Stylonychia lemnae]
MGCYQVRRAEDEFLDEIEHIREEQQTLSLKKRQNENKSLIKRVYSKWDFGKIGKITEIANLSAVKKEDYFNQRKEGVIRLQKLTDNVVITAHIDLKMCIWDIQNCQLLFMIDVPLSIVDIRVAEGKFLAAVLGDTSPQGKQYLYIWESIIEQFKYSDIKLIGKFDIENQITCLTSLVFSHEKYLILASLYGDLIVYDMETFEKSEEINIHNGCQISDIKECLTNFRLRGCIITGCADGTIKITSLRLEKEKIAEIAEMNCGKQNPVTQVSELRNYMIVASSLNKIFFWVLDNPKQPIKIFDTHTMPIHRLLTIDDGLYLLSVGGDGKLGVWRGKQQKLLYHSPRLHSEIITDVLKVGDRIITVSLDKNLKVHEIIYLFNNYEWIK